MINLLLSETGQCPTLSATVRVRVLLLCGHFAAFVCVCMLGMFQWLRVFNLVSTVHSECQ